MQKFIEILNCKGLVRNLDDSVTHMIVTSNRKLQTYRTQNYLHAVASGVLIVSHLWVEACMKDRSNINKVEDWEVSDEELEEHGPYRARKRKELGKDPVLTGFEVVVKGEFAELSGS